MIYSYLENFEFFLLNNLQLAIYFFMYQRFQHSDSIAANQACCGKVIPWLWAARISCLQLLLHLLHYLVLQLVIEIGKGIDNNH
jgi:hypothetical protein